MLVIRINNIRSACIYYVYTVIIYILNVMHQSRKFFGCLCRLFQQFNWSQVLLNLIILKIFGLNNFFLCRRLRLLKCDRGSRNIIFICNLTPCTHLHKDCEHALVLFLALLSQFISLIYHVQLDLSHLAFKELAVAEISR